MSVFFSTTGCPFFFSGSPRSEARAYNSLALRANGDGDSWTAREAFERAASLQPNEYKYALSAANMHLKEGDFEMASSLYRSSLTRVLLCPLCRTTLANHFGEPLCRTTLANHFGEPLGRTTLSHHVGKPRVTPLVTTLMTPHRHEPDPLMFDFLGNFSSVRIRCSLVICRWPNGSCSSRRR